MSEDKAEQQTLDTGMAAR
jgi:hypothetical protein